MKDNNNTIEQLNADLIRQEDNLKNADELISLFCRGLKKEAHN